MPTATFPDNVFYFIMENFKGVGPSEMVEKLNSVFGTEYSVSQLKVFYRNHHLNSGVSGYFEKGHIPFNKGRKGISYEGMKATQFKKGNLPHNTKPIGYERVSKDGYIEVKVAMRPSSTNKNDNWVSKQRLIWTQHYGPIPSGHNVIFKDGNKRNFDIENLALVSNSVLVRLNQNHLTSDDPHLTEVGISIATLKKEIGKKSRKHKSDG